MKASEMTNEERAKGLTFDDGFHLMMSSSIEYAMLKRQGKEIPEELDQRMKKWFSWVDNLSNEEYDSLIH